MCGYSLDSCKMLISMCWLFCGFCLLCLSLFSETGSPGGTQAGLALPGDIPFQPSKCWDSRLDPTHLLSRSRKAWYDMFSPKQGPHCCARLSEALAKEPMHFRHHKLKQTGETNNHTHKHLLRSGERSHKASFKR